MKLVEYKHLLVSLKINTIKKIRKRIKQKNERTRIQNKNIKSSIGKSNHSIKLKFKMNCQKNNARS